MTLYNKMHNGGKQNRSRQLSYAKSETICQSQFDIFQEIWVLTKIRLVPSF